MDRRDFLRVGAATGSSIALSNYGRLSPAAPREAARAVQFSDPGQRRLADLALNAAREAGASYADIRIADYRRQYLATREQRVEYVDDSEDSGFGVRVIANGTWGFAASATLSDDEIVATARLAVRLAKANSKLRSAPVTLTPAQAHEDIWQTPIERDPFGVSLEEKIDALLGINAEALRVKQVSFCSSSMNFAREHKFFASTDGSYIEQTLYRCDPSFTVTSVAQGSFQTRNSFASPQGAGYEYIESYPWFDEARQAGEDAVAKHSAPSVKPGARDIILHPTNLWLTIHESIGHPTELDRALGFEANYAGTSFLTPDKLGELQLGSDIVNLVAENTRPGSLATCGYDDDGVRTQEWLLVRDGMFVDYQTTREQAHVIGRPRSYGTAYAQSWSDPPLQRMPNINLLPGQAPLTLDQLIGATDDGILIKGHGSFSIDQQRYNFQFGGQTFHEIKGGRVVGMLKDVAYQARTPDFWRACDAICGADEYRVGGSFYCGKGEPIQTRPVSHGCPPARFRRVNILNSARKV